VVYDLGAHLIDTALQLFGMPVAVFADMMIMRQNSLVDDYFEIILYHATFRVRLKATMFAKTPQGFIIHGSKGSFTKSRSDVQETQLQKNKSPLDADYGFEQETEYGILHAEKDGIFVKEQISSERGNYAGYYEGIYQSIINQQPLPVTAESGKNVIEIIEKAYQSHNRKKIITV
jgi:predicted dehydrogenase